MRTVREAIAVMLICSFVIFFCTHVVCFWDEKNKEEKQGELIGYHEELLERCEPELSAPTNSPTPTPVPNLMIEYYQTDIKNMLNSVAISAVIMEFEYIGDYFITAYCPEECGYRIYSDGSDNFPNGWITATGTICHREEEWYKPSTCGINTKYLDYGDVLYIDGKVYVAEDTGYVTMPLIDLFMPSYEQMMQHGSHWTDVYSVKYVETESVKGWHFDINEYWR